MRYPDQKAFSKNDGASEPEATLRLIASLPAPEGLEDRVHAALQAASRRARVLAWPGAPAGEWMRAAAAAAIVFVVAGGGWGIYAHVQPVRAVQGIAGPRVAAPGGFSEGGAVRRPQTLVGPTVKPQSPAVTPVKKLPAKSAATPTPSTHSTAANISAAQPASTPVQ
jgi:hypothetical protein